jgi:hypothetical protein
MGRKATALPAQSRILSPPDREPTKQERAAARAAQIPLDWIALTDDVAQTWFPPETFPTWAVEFVNHPVQRFVSACMVWDPASIDAETWIERHPLHLGTTHYNISGIGEPTPDPDETYSRVRYEETVERLLSCARAGEQITEEVIEREIKSAHEVAEAARTDALGKAIKRDYHYVWIWPGMKAADWDALKPEVLAVAEASSWKATAHAWEAEGMSHARIARELGVPRTTVIEELQRQ